MDPRTSGRRGNKGQESQRRRKPADLFTKNLAEAKVSKFMDMIGELYVEGRAEAGLKLK